MKTIFIKYLLVISFLGFTHCCLAEKGLINITVKFDKSIKVEQMELCYWENLISSYTGFYTGSKILKSEISQGKFHFTIKTEEPFIYLRLGWKHDDYGNLIGEGSYQPYLFIGERGDDISLRIDSTWNGYDFFFSGNGAAKYNCKNILAKKYDLLLQGWATIKDQNYSSAYRSWRIRRYRDMVNFFIQEQLGTLSHFKEELSAFAFNVFKTDIISDAYDMLTYQYNSLLQYAPLGETDEGVQKVVRTNTDEDLINLRKIIADLPKESLVASAYYSDCLLSFAKIDAKLNKKLVVDEITKVSDSEIRDKMYASYFIVSGQNLTKNVKDSLLNNVSNKISNRDLLKTVLDIGKRTSKGAPVYDFSLPDIDGNLVKLSDFRGKVVFVDFWFVGCGGCSGYHQDVVKPVKDHYKNVNDVVFVTISVDKDPEKWIKGLKSGLYTTDQAINLRCPDGNYDPVIKQFNINGYPQPLLIDRQGLVFTDSKKELREDGTKGLIENIERARKMGIVN